MVVESSRPPDVVLAEFVRIAHRVVWCTVATVDRHGRPRSRVLHPYWERTDDGITGWAFTRPTPLKLAHLAHRPFVSCSYWDPAHEVAVAECDAELAADDATRRTVWDLFATAAPPLGYDPRILGAVDHVVVLRMTPWRLRVPTAAWRRADHSAALGRVG